MADNVVAFKPKEKSAQQTFEDVKEELIQELKTYINRLENSQCFEVHDEMGNALLFGSFTTESKDESRMVLRHGNRRIPMDCIKAVKELNRFAEAQWRTFMMQEPYDKD